MAARVFKVEFRIAVAQRILNGESVSALATSSRSSAVFFIVGAMLIANRAGRFQAGRGAGRRAQRRTAIVEADSDNCRSGAKDGGVGASTGKDGAGKRFFKQEPSSE